MTQRVNYDRIAALYDADRHRSKEVDSDLLAFLAEGAVDKKALTGLDIGCGTGNQLVANRPHVPQAELVGLDFHFGMLQQAQVKIKANELNWVQGDGARLPFRAASFDFISNQFAFHHVRDKPAMIAEVFRVLRPGGRFVMTNLSVRDMPGWLVYHYFPQAWQADLEDWLPKDEILTLMRAAGFSPVTIKPSSWQYEEDLAEFMAVVRRRVLSQLLTISDEQYQAGLTRLEAELVQAGGQVIIKPSEIYIVKLIGDKAA